MWAAVQEPQVLRYYELRWCTALVHVTLIATGRQVISFSAACMALPLLLQQLLTFSFLAEPRQLANMVKDIPFLSNGFRIICPF